MINKNTKKNCFYSKKNNRRNQYDLQKQNQNIFEIYRNQKRFEKLKKFVTIIVVVVTNLHKIQLNDIFIRVNVNIFKK